MASPFPVWSPDSVVCPLGDKIAPLRTSDLGDTQKDLPGEVGSERALKNVDSRGARACEAGQCGTEIGG